MKKFVSLLASFILGAIISATITQWLSQKTSDQVLDAWVGGNASALAIYGTLLSEKRYDDLQNLIESGIHQTLLFQEAFSPKSHYLHSKRQIRGYFDETERKVPQAIESHISDIPTGKGVDMKTMADFAVAHIPDNG